MSSIRESVIREMQSSIGLEQWKANEVLVNELKELIHNHPINQHPVIDALNRGEYSLETMKRIHLEYREIVRIFTDALLMAQFSAYQVEDKLKVGSKALPRFLLTLNVLDEFGFKYSEDNENGYFGGNPRQSHLILFEQLLTQLGISDRERNDFQPSEETLKIKQKMQSAYNNFNELIIYLCVCERVVILFSSAMRKNLELLGIDIDGGYYSVHGVSTDLNNEGYDDHHEYDMLNILTYCLNEFHEEKYYIIQNMMLNLWQNFWNAVTKIN